MSDNQEKGRKFCAVAIKDKEATRSIPIMGGPADIISIMRLPSAVCVVDLSDPDTLAAMREVARVLDLLTRQYEKGPRPIVAQVPVDSVRYARLVVAQEIIESKLREE